MKTLGLIAQKGGTGKTTLTIHLAVEAAIAGLKVLILDIDPQASASAWWRRRGADQPDLIQSDGEALEEVLQTAGQRGYDLTVIDTAPHSSRDARRCASLCDRVLIPTRPAILDLDAIRPSVDLVTELGVPARILLNGCPPPTAFGEPHILSEAREALAVYGVPVCEAAVSQRVGFSYALIEGRGVTEYDPRGKAANEIVRLWSILRQELAL